MSNLPLSTERCDVAIGSVRNLNLDLSNLALLTSLAVDGVPYRTSTGEMSVLATENLQTLASSLQPIAVAISDPEVKSHNRHVERIVDPTARDPLILRSELTNCMRRFFLDRDFVEVNTPLLTAMAGGAAATPFETRSEVISDLKLQLRIAPELFLKRLIIGDMPKVFEIGPAFRNEGEGREKQTKHWTECITLTWF